MRKLIILAALLSAPPAQAAWFPTFSGDCTTAGPGQTVLTCAKTNGVSFGALAILNTLNLSTLATGTLQAAQFPALTGDVTTSAGSLTTTIGAGAVTAAKMASGAAVGNLGFTPLAPANNLSEISSAATARANIGAAASGANSDIASLSGLTTALSTGQGGTGNNTGAADSLTVGGTALSTVIAGLPTLAGANTFSGANKFTSTTLPSAAAGALALGGQLSALSSLSANGEGQAYLLSAYGLVLQGDGSTYDIALVARNNTLALGVTTGTGNVVVGNQITARTFQSSGPAIALSGSTVPARIGSFGGTLSGTSTISGNTWGSYAAVLSSGDNATINSGAFDAILVSENFGGSSFTGGRGGMHVSMILNTASTLNGTSDGLTGIASKVMASVSGGGSASGNLGSLFGANVWCDLQTGATYYTQCVGEEVDGAVQSGASVGNFAVEQFVLTSDHATHGTNVDAMVRITAQVGASAGVRNLILFGDAFSQWPIDPNGYLIETQMSGNNLTVPATAAGGIDLLQATFSGSGATGGGFAFRSTGMQVDQNGRVQSGFGLLDGTSGGLTVNTTEQKMTSAAVSAGGSNFTSNDIVTDAYGNVLRVTASGGAVTAVSIVKSGYSTSPPSNPVAFTAQTKNGSSIGSGLTVTETWTGASTLTLAANGSGTVGLGSGSDALQLVGSGMFTANGSTSACVGSLGPSGVHSSVQEWLTVKDSAGTVRYIPAC